MSDEEDFEDSGSGEDFDDNSEDDWKPEGESEDESEQETGTGSSPSPDKNKRRSRATPAVKKKGTAQKPSQAKTTTTGKKMSASILELLASAKAKKREKLSISVTAEPGPSQQPKDKSPPKKLSTSYESEDSSSSGDENLVDPSKLDLRSSFFKPTEPQPDRIPTPNFDCNIGVGTLSDSDEEGSSSQEDSNKDDSNKAIDVMENLRNFNQNIDDAKENLKKYTSKKSSSETTKHTTTDVSQLLALGETNGVQDESLTKTRKKIAAPKKRARKQEESGESDWEEVEDVKVEEKRVEKPLEDVHVLLDVNPDRRRQKIQNELEVALKRQLNKEKRDQQLVLHRNGFKEWLERGNHINGILNDTTLFSMALKLLPSAQAYPKDKADLKYFEQITKWYVGAVKVSATADMYPPLVDDLDLKASLRKQIESKSVKSKRDFVLIFIVLLRAIGIQCRMLVNVVAPPIRPLQSELCRITMKPKAETSMEKKSKKSPADAKRSKVSKKNKKEEDDDGDSDYDEIAEKLSTSKKTKKLPSSSSKSKEKSSTRDKSDTKPSTNSSSADKKKTTSSDKSKQKKESITTTATVKSPPPIRATRSKQVIPQMDGMDDVVSSPVGKRTRSRSNTPVPPLIKKVLLSQKSTESPIKLKRKANGNTLNVPGADASELFAIDPQEKKTVTKPRKSPSRVRASTSAAAEDSDAPPPAKKVHRLAEVKRIDRRVFSTDDEDLQKDQQKPKAGQKVDFWTEVWSEQEEKWMCVDLFKKKVDSPESIIRSTTVPIAYVLAWSNNSSVKDVSLRYCPQWHSVNKKMRADQEFIDKAMKPFIGTPSTRDQKEDVEMKRLILDRPMPTSISEFKNHPLYALKRHLLKFEAIYPPNPLTLGFVRGEPVYARECVHTLHSRELWVKQARVVKPGETPYKIVTARPKWERATNTVIKDQPLEIFGHWQTSEYEPPVAENGVVPKNPYGNVELFKACMLPINTVHLPYPGLNKVCKRLKIDYAPAVVGFEFHSGYSHPVYEGYVVCKEFAELVTDEWVKDTEEAAKREAEKFQERVYGNWKRLIKGLLIKKRLQLKYNFEDKD